MLAVAVFLLVALQLEVKAQMEYPYEISIGGRCVCNGHADTCAPDPKDEYKLKCECRHHTCGDSCEYCCPEFVQKVWREAVPESANDCEECNCYGHSTACLYDEEVSIRRLSIDLRGNYDGGGVCQNCSHHTAGINCERCMEGYYRPANIDLRDRNGCRPCDCDSAFTVGTCEPVTGRCYSKREYAGDRCDRCASGYHEIPDFGQVQAELPDEPERVGLCWKFRGSDSYIRISKEQLVERGFYEEKFNLTFIGFKFKTQQRNGLLFFTGQDTQNFVAIEIRDGKLVVVCNFGFEEPRHEISDVIEDVSTVNRTLTVKLGVLPLNNTLHVVLFSNRQRAVHLKLTDYDYDLNTRGDVWFGGIHRYDLKSEFKPYVTNIDVNYRGCIKDLQFRYRDPYSIFDATERVGVNRGCERDAVPAVTPE